MKVIIGKETLVYSVPVNENTSKWGVYAIPRMWRDISGKLVVRFNGERDVGDTDNMQIVPHLYFVSEDNGKTWLHDPEGEKNYPCNVVNGIGNVYTQINGSTLAFREQQDRAVIENVPVLKEFLTPVAEALVVSYRYGDIPEACKGLERLRYENSTEPVDILPVTIDFPEREILINKEGEIDGKYVPVTQKVKQSIFKNNYICSVTPLPDGTLVAVSCGQHPEVQDHYNAVAYLMESRDMGLTWTKRGTIAESTEMPYGYTGDGNEITMARTPKGTLICAMRTEMSINPDVAKPICDTIVAISHDDGYTWEKPFSIADSSVTPQVRAFENGVIAVVYGRPGVHFKYSVDEGKTWSDSYSIIGKTLEEYRKDGISDADSKYFDSCSYSNLFVEKISEDTMLVLYNNNKYDEGDGVKHKAGFVRTVTFTNE